MKMGFGFFIGVFLVLWGLFELARNFGYIPRELNFPWFAILLIAIGLSMVLKRVKPL
ncbi:hypothetical protein KJ765_02830 [Candidatus Micrarchaeota archaeon]|nr:hypothetical protein [Candidatus Micrarchaeota archaeon]